MIDHSAQSKPGSRLKRNLLIAGVVALCAIVIFLLWPRADVASGRSGAVPQFSTRAEHAAAPVAATAKPPSAALSPESRPAESDWEKLRARIVALLKGRKVEVCGLSDLDAALFLAEHEELEGLTMNKSEMGKGAANAALSEASAKLIQSNSLRDQALGLYVQAHQAEWAAIDEGIKAKRCKGDMRCESEAWEPKPQVRAAVAEPLVKMALAERDPAIYATAIYACGNTRIDACAGISYLGWARIDPDNAAVWLMVASEAAAQKDLAARDEAMRRAASASGYDTRIPSLATLFESKAVKAQPPLERMLIGNSLNTITALAWSPPYGALGSYCVRGETTDPARKGVCDALANKLLDLDKSLVGHRAASRIGEKIGWDAARLQTLRDESVVEFALALDIGLTENEYSCENLAKSDQWTQKLLSKGDRGIALERIARTGKSITELVEAYCKTNTELFK